MANNNKWRRRIIRLLEGLLQDLQSRPPNDKQATDFKKLAPDRADSILEGVEGVEVAESLYYTKPIEIPKTNDRILYMLQPCAEDTAFAVYCYLQDATYFRLFSARAWRNFALGHVGIQTAAFCTSNADAQIGKMSDDLRKSFGTFQETWMTRMHPKLDAFLRRHCGDDATVSGSQLDWLQPDCDDVAFARNAKRRLGYYASTMLCTRLTRSLFQNFLSSTGYHWGTEQDHTPVLKSLFQLRCLVWLTGPFASILKRDCMFLIAHALVHGHLDSDAVLAAQMLFDTQKEVDPTLTPVENIVELLGEDYNRVYQHYKSLWNHEHIKTAHPLRFERMCAQHDLLLYATTSTDHFQQTMDTTERMTGRYFDVPDFELLHHVPSLVGQVVAQYHFEFQRDFLDLSNDYGHILTAIHFYNAAKKSGHLQTQQWEDIEWVIGHQSYHAIFAGEPPTKNTDYASRFCLVYGLDATKFAFDRRDPVIGQVKNDIHLENGSLRRLESCSRYVRISSVFAKASVPPNQGQKGRNQFEMMNSFAHEGLDFASPHGKPSNIGILVAAKEAFDRDEEAMNFDIFGFHLKCHDLIERIRAMCIEEAPNDYPAIRFGNEQSANLVFAELLRDLADCPRHHGRMWPKAVKMLSKLIEEEGSLYCDATLERMTMATLGPTSSDSDDTDASSHAASESTLPEIPT